MTYPTTTEVAARTYYPIAVPVTAVPVPCQLQGSQLIGGWSFIETTGAASATLQLVDGGSAQGTVLAEIGLSPGQSVRDLAPGDGLLLQTGLFINVTAGSVRGAVWMEHR